MPEIGENVQVHYVGTLDDGTQFDSSRDRGEPLEFTIGARKMLPLFEKAVSEMQVGERKQIRLEAAQAYGERDEGLVMDVPTSVLAGASQLSSGQRITLMTKMGPISAEVLQVGEQAVRLDCNHELAGKAINFDIELLAVKHESAIEREMHGEGCACGCHKLKESLERQGVA